MPTRAAGRIFTLPGQFVRATVMQPGGAVRMGALLCSGRLAVAIAVEGIAAFGVAGCSHTTTLTPSSADTPAAATSAATPAAATPAAEPGVKSYLCAFTDGNMLLQWNSANGYLSGTYQDAAISGTAPQEQVNTNQGDLGGTTSGSGGITLNIGTATWYGTIGGSSVTLNVPQNDGSIQPVTCNQAGVSDWNSAVTQLRSQVTTDNNTTLQAQASESASAAQAQQVSNAQQALASDVSSLQSDTSSLNTDTSLAGDVNQMKQDYGQEQSDWKTEQSDDCSSVIGDADTVGGDADTVGGDLDTLNGDINTLQSGGIQSVQTDLSDVQTDLSNLQSLGVAPAMSSATASASGKQALTNAANAISWAQGQAKTINGEAQALATTAQNWANQHGC
jgi:hypothetical protein